MGRLPHPRVAPKSICQKNGYEISVNSRIDKNDIIKQSPFFSKAIYPNNNNVIITTIIIIIIIIITIIIIIILKSLFNIGYIITHTEKFK